MPARMGNDDGFTLIEVLVTIVIGMVVLAAALELMTVGFKSSATVQDRHDTTGRARVTLDRATAVLQAQVCNGDLAPVSEAAPDLVRFTATRGPVGSPPKGYVLKWDSATRTLIEEEYDLGNTPDGDGRFGTDPGGNWSTSITPKTTTLVERAVPENPGDPVFTYWGTDDTLVNDPVQFTNGTVSLAAPEMARILRVDINLRVLPTRTKTEDDRTSTLLSTSSYVASNIDPTKLDKGPQCS